MDNAEIIESLKKAKELLTKFGWTKGAYARNRNDLACNPNDPMACKFCITGAFYRSASLLGVSYYDVYNYFSSKNNIDSGLVGWNDDWSTTKKEVLAAFDKAIGV